MGTSAPPLGLDVPLRRLRAKDLTTSEEARAALEDNLQAADPEDPSAARRALRGVLHRFDPVAPTVRGSFQETAAKLLEPWFSSPEAARHVAWTVFEEPSRNGSGSHHGPEVEILSLAELLKDPQSMEPPTPQVFPLGWRGRVALLSAREKFGKSTLARGAIAALSRGRPFLGRTPEAANCLHLALEEHRSDVVRSLAEFDAYGPAVFIVERLGADPFHDLEVAVRETEAAFVVVDTLAAFTETLEAESGDAAAWTAVMQSFGRLARDTEAAFCLVHHGRKADGSYRDSTAIGAGADMLIALDEGDVEGVRKLKPKGRWELKPMSYRIRPPTNDWPHPTFQLTAGDLSVDTMVLMYVEANPGCSTNDVKKRITGRAQEVGSAIHRLNGKAIEDRGDGQRSAWHVKDGR